MKLSIITTITNPWNRQDPWEQAITCYADIADEVIVVNGGEALPKEFLEKFKNVRQVQMYWAPDWSWHELPLHLNLGLKEASGDWVIKLDIDQFFHEKDKQHLRDQLEKLYSFPLVTFQKFSIYPFKKMQEKGQVFVGINKRSFSGKIRFGLDPNRYTDLCRPIWLNGMDSFGVPTGQAIDEGYGRTGISIYNFDYTFKEIDIARQEFFRFSQAHERYFGQTSWGHTVDESFAVFRKYMQSKIDKSSYTIVDDSILPKYIREWYHNLKQEQFGYNGWGVLHE